MTKDEMIAKLDADVAAGRISAGEAEHEYQDIVNPEYRYCGQEW